MKKKETKKSGEKFASGLKAAFHVTKELVILVITALMVLLAVLAIVYRDRLSLDGLKRWVAYGTMAKDEEGQTDEFLFSSGSDSAFASLDGGLLLCSDHALTLYSASGKEEISEEVTMKDPVVSVSGSYAVAYDVGGSSLFVFHGASEAFSYTTSEGSTLLSARVNDSGYLAVVEQSSGHKATVTVYDNSYEPRIGINESTNFVSDAVVSEDNSAVAVTELYQNGDAFGTDLVLYQLSDASALATTAIGDQVVLDLDWEGDRIWLQQEHGVTVLDSTGAIVDTWEDTSRYLEGYSLEGSDFAVELLSKYQSGSVGELRVIGEDGQQTVSRTVSEEVLSISAAGKYIAVLTTGTLTIYREDLQEYASVANHSVHQVIMREDGSALLIGTENARLFVP